MRVISGIARGTKLNSIDSLSTRPTLDRVKEPLFSILQTKIENSIILDLFSGSGAIAIEFLSRGAKKAYLCENNHEAVCVIKNNLQKTRLEQNAVIFQKDYKKALEILKEENIKFDLVYIDPPYVKNLAVNSVKKILELDLLNEDAIIIIETDQEARELEQLSQLEIAVLDNRKYGRVSLLFCKKTLKL